MKRDFFSGRNFVASRDVADGLATFRVEAVERKNPEHLREMANVVFPAVVDLCRRAVLPSLRDRDIKVVRRGNDLASVVTTMDIDASRFFLDGDKTSHFPGFHALYPGSFTEEVDSGYRAGADVIYENDPCDGTGDAVKTAESDRPLWPTNITAKLMRDESTGLFVPITGLVYDVMGEYGVMSDGQRAFLGVPNQKGRFQKIPVRSIEHRVSKKVSVSWRESYPQDNVYLDFYKFLEAEGWEITKVRCGGAGDQALRLARGCFEPAVSSVCPDFADLEPVDIIFNAQPDWKTWDTDATRVIGRALGWSEPTDIFGERLIANASGETLKDMYHSTGTVFSYSSELASEFISLARKFRDNFPNKPLNATNY